MRTIEADKLIGLIDDDIASLDFMNMAMSRESYDICLCTLRMVKQYIKVLSTAEPIKHGRWVIEPDATIIHCDACGWAFEYYGGLEEEWNNCPHCGAIMDEVENETNRRRQTESPLRLVERWHKGNDNGRSQERL